MICSYNCIEYVSVLLAAGLAGFVLVPMDINTPPELFKTVMKETRPRLFLFSSSVPAAASIELPQKSNKILIEELFNLVRDISAGALRKRDFFIGDEDLYEIVYTSGTTGNPKGVMLTHKNITGNIRSLRERMISRPSWNYFSILPLSHMFGQVMGCFYPLRFGCSVTYIPGYKKSAIASAIKDGDITVVVTIPELINSFRNSILQSVRKKGKLKTFKKMVNSAGPIPFFVKRLLFNTLYKKIGQKLSVFMCGGASLNLEAEKFWEAVGVRILQGYGMTEASPVISTGSIADRLIGSVGKSLPRQGIKISEDGEVLTCGENVSKGYYKHPELNKENIVNGWLKTGDIGRIDKEGNLYIMGRKKNMLVASSGLNIYPEDIENKIMKHASVKTCMVFGNYDKNDNLTINAVVIPFDRKKINTENIKTWVNNQLQKHQIINNIHIWPGDDFPRTTTQKIKRNIVIDRINSKKSGKKEKSSPGGGSKFLSILSRISKMPEKNIKSGHLITEDLGLDSLKLVELIIAIENEFDIRIDDQEFLNNVTVSGMEKFIGKGAGISEEVEIPSWPRAFPACFLRSFLFNIFKSIFFKKVSIKISGIKNLENVKSPFIFISNHQSHLDTPTILSSLPKKIRRRTAVAAADDYFFQKNRKSISFIFSILFNIFPFYRKKKFSTNFKNIGKLIDRNWSILIYPEGTRSLDGKVQAFKSGIGVLAKTMNTSIIPIKIDGLYNILPKGSRKINPGQVKVIFGPAVNVSAIEDYNKITRNLEKIVCTLK